MGGNTQSISAPAHQRILQRTQVDSSAPGSMRSGRVYYLNGANNDLGYEKEIKDNGLIEHKHYLSAGGIVFAMQITRSGNTATGGASGSAKASQSLQYLHHDHLGSVAVVTDDTGSVIERLAYDPWGKRRFPNGTADTTDSIVGLTLDRGFTMHEHLDEMGVIHMNGRIYDPLIGRFMSADPFIQAPENLQSYNRFAYVMNNPLSYTDPSGYFSLKKFLKLVVSIVVAVYAPGFFATHGISVAGMSAATANFINAAAAGFLAGAVSSGNLKGALQGAFTAGLFHMAGLAGGVDGAASPERYLAHAAAGCVSAVAGGGKCGSGMVSAVFGKYSTNWMNDTFGKELSFGRGVAAAVAGGVGSVLGGGKFENGAVTAAYGYLFNELSGFFDKRTGLLTLIDSDSKKVYVASVFSGGTGGAEAIPDGDYDILSFGESNKRFRLEPRDTSYGDDRHDSTGRNEFRLHPRGMGINYGCIASVDESSWNTTSLAISSTQSFDATVLSKPNRFGYGGGKPEAARNFGSLKVYTSVRQPGM